MTIASEREKIYEEVRRIPEDRLAEAFAILRGYRQSIEGGPTNGSNVMQYAGVWKDMPADEFDEFLDDVSSRRHNAFSRRRDREAGVD